MLSQSYSYKIFGNASNNGDTGSGSIEQRITASIPKLVKGIGLIRPDNIALEIEKLKIKRKSSALPLLMEALDLYTSSVPSIYLFDLGGDDVPPSMPFIIAPSPVAAPQTTALSNKLSAPRNVGKCVYLNMYRIGKWSEDGSQYEGLESLSDLISCLETGVIAYHMLCCGEGDDILRKTDVLSNLVRLYTGLFYISFNMACKSPFVGDSFNNDAIYYTAAKFFMIHNLGMAPSDTTDKLAWEYGCRYDTTFDSLKLYEDTLDDIKYDNANDFITQLSSSMYKAAANYNDFTASWQRTCGEGCYLAIEYVPYLLHYLFAALHNARLGNMNRLSNRAPDLAKDGLQALHAAVVSKIR
jgi:hypothetical protein